MSEPGAPFEFTPDPQLEAIIEAERAKFLAQFPVELREVVAEQLDRLTERYKAEADAEVLRMLSLEPKEARKT